MRFLISILCIFFMASALAVDLPNTPTSFSKAKRILYKEIYRGHEKTFYCGCDFNAKARTVNLDSCQVKPRKNPKRASRIEAEHVMPAAHFGQHRECWRNPEKVCGKKMSGRQCCEQSDPVFEAAHNDLHNLFPSVGEINGDRSNYAWGMIPGEKRNYGNCDIEVDSSIRRAEPPESVKGDIARVYFYMEHTYGFNLSNQQRQLFTAWSKQDPPDEWENQRNGRIAKIQGRGNPFITLDITPGQKGQPKTLPTFNCEPRKTCGQMASCAEAQYHLTECGNKRLDRDNDGIPCEALCRE